MEGELDRTHIINTPFETWRVFGIIDDTCIKTTRPGSGPIDDSEHAPRRVGAHEIQRAFYSGYMRAHGLKYQTLLLPNGMLGSVWGSAISHNDVGVMNMSGLEDHLQEILDFIPGTTSYPTLFGDAIFVPSPVVTNRIQNSTQEQTIIDRRMNSIRQSVELTYGLFFGLFHYFREPRRLQMLNKAELHYRTGMVGFFLLNCYTCIRGNVVTSFFNVQPPSIEEYLPLDENIPPYVPFQLNMNYNYVNQYLYLKVINEYAMIDKYE